ncbi:MAG: helix-turn-helix domain-containing protein [Vicinamibacterales bacterium]
MNLKELREQSGCATQESAAERVGVNQTTISKLEAGEVASPRLDTLQKLADGYGVDLSVVIAAVRESVAEAA